MLQDLPGDGGHAARGRAALALDQLHAAQRVPAVHQHDLAAGGKRAVEHRHAAGDMEERHRQQHAFLRGRGIGRRNRLATAQQVAQRAETARGRDGGGVAMRAQRALGFAGGAGGIEDGGIVLRIDLDLWGRLLRQRGPV
ncbi:hypothetical protein D9M72_405320 [compost metagenome]